MDVAALVDPVTELIHRTADDVVRPRFRALAAHEVSEKAPGEVVTVADREAEQAIAAGLARLAPGVPVVGEEGVAADATSAGVIARAPYCWLVDPLDGTGNFVAGSPDFAMMIALLCAGRPVGAWVLQPEHGVLWTAERGAGTRRDGVAVSVRDPGPDLSVLRVGVLTRFLDARTSEAVDAARGSFASVTEPPRCAGITYPALIEGGYNAVLFWRTLPWDHAPGALLLTEAGGTAARPDGTRYDVTDDRVGLLAVAHAPAWSGVRDALLGPGGAP